MSTAVCTLANLGETTLIVRTEAGLACLGSGCFKVLPGASVDLRLIDNMVITVRGPLEGE